MKTATYRELARGGNAALNFHFALEECRKQGVQRLLVEPGVYELDPQFCSQRYLAISNHGYNGPKRIGVVIEDMADFEIDFRGSTLVCGGFMTAIAVLNSQNITVRNVKLKNPTVPLMECKITAHGEGFVEAEILTGQGSMVLEHRRFHQETFCQMTALMHCNIEFDGATGEIACGTADNTFGIQTAELEFEKLDENHLRIFGGTRKPPIGNVVNFSAIRRLGAGIFCQHSENLKFENVDVCSCYGMGLLAQVCENITLNSFNTLREDGRLVTAGADATHFVHCTGLIRVENSTFIGQLDDALNIHGMYTRILDKGENWIMIRQVHVDSTGLPIYGAGHRIRILPPDTLLPYTEKTVARVEVINDECWILHLAEDTGDIRVGDDAENLTLNCDLIFRNNVVRDNRARGMLIGNGGKVLIEKNFFHTSGTAVKFESDGAYWFESGATTDVTIRENHFCGCKYGGWGDAVIEFQPREKEEEGRYFHGTVRVADNTFTAGLPELVSISNAADFQFAGNTLDLDEPYVCVRHVGARSVQDGLTVRE